MTDEVKNEVENLVEEIIDEVTEAVKEDSIEDLLKFFAEKYSLLAPATALLNNEMEAAVKKGIQTTFQELPSWQSFYDAQVSFEAVVNELGKRLNKK